MLLLKSEKAKLELTSKQRALSVRERSALFLADGIRTRDELVGLLQGDRDMLQRLMADGYLMPAKSSAAPRVGKADFAVSKTSALSGVRLLSQPAYLATVPAPLAGFTTGRTVSQAVTDFTSSSDTFEGKRSLATTRMFLFDIVERMFVRKMPELADQYRDQLRGAKDRVSMLAIARNIVTSVEEIAGHDRADGLSERLAMMLPSEH